MKCSCECLCCCSEYCLRSDSPKLAAVLQPRCDTGQFVSVLQVTHFSCTRTIFCSSPPFDPFFQVRQFRDGSCADRFSRSESSISKDSWRPKQLLSRSSTRPASLRRRAVTHFHPLSRFEPSALQALTRSNCIAKAAVSYNEHQRRHRCEPSRSRTSPI